jgi:hypothetical protein
MSAIGAAFARGIASLGGPQVAAAVVVGGIVVGGLGGGFIASRSTSGQSVAPSGELAVYPCPNQGPALIAVKGGQKLLATGRTEDGTWLRIHYPLPGRTEAWIQTTPVTVEGAVASLPVATCAAEVAMAAPDVRPGPSLTVTANNPPSLPPSPTAGPTAAPSSGPTPPPNARPSLAALTVSTSKVSYDTASYCPTATKKVTFKVNAADTSGLGSVTLFWREPGAATYAQSAMSRTAGTAKSGTWQVTLDTKANGITKAGTLAYYAIGTDTAGATRRIPTSGANAITVAVCANTGPTITSVSSSAGSLLYLDPQGVGCSPTTTNITAVVKDVDGIKSVTLFYRRPGGSAWSSKPMNNNTIPGKWYANLDTLGDKISPTGTLSWYIKAVDGRNVASQTRTASITIKRCDTTAPNLKPYAPNPNIIGSAIVVGVPNCGTTTVEIRISASDNETGIKSVTGTLFNARSGATIGKLHTLKLQSASVYRTTFNAANGAIPVGYYYVRFVAKNGAGLTATANSTAIQVASCP